MYAILIITNSIDIISALVQNRQTQYFSLQVSPAAACDLLAAEAGGVAGQRQPDRVYRRQWHQRAHTAGNTRPTQQQHQPSAARARAVRAD